MGFFNDIHKKIVRKVGFKTDQEGILKRYLREGEGWNPHLQQTRKYILDAANRITRKKRAVVLGSGWLLDVPVEELTKIFREVWLVDIVHPAQIVHKMKKLKSVKLITADITGGAAQAVMKAFDAAKKPDLQAIQFKGNQFGIANFNIEHADFIVSVNLLNQLDILLADYIRTQNKHTPLELMDLRQKIQQQHIDNLPFGKTCLITDFQENLFTSNGEQIESKTLVYADFPAHRHYAEWTWHFDTKKTYHPEYETHFQVKAMQW